MFIKPRIIKGINYEVLESDPSAVEVNPAYIPNVGLEYDILRSASLKTGKSIDV